MRRLKFIALVVGLLAGLLETAGAADYSDLGRPGGATNFSAPPGPILLARTPAAPPGAFGSASILAGPLAESPASVSLDLRGLNAGRYQLGVIRRSDEVFIPLARFAIGDPTLGPDPDSSSNQESRSSGHQAEALVSQYQLALKESNRFNDVLKLVVVDSRGNYVLEGNFPK